MFDIIGDVHGCSIELLELLTALGYFEDSYNRTVVFCGDLTDRGPANDTVLTNVMDMVDNGNCLVVLGNHDDKLRRYLRGNKVTISHGLGVTVDQISSRSPAFAAQVLEFLEGLPYKLLLDDDKLCISHAGLSEKYQEEVSGKSAKKARSMALYGKTTGKTLPNGFPERLDWAENYSGSRIVVHGHVAGLEPVIKNNVYNIDTACVFGGSLTALRYPEMSLVSIPAKKQYSKGNF